jgi:hypothetical protein
MTLLKNKPLLLFIVLWLHISLLDLFFVTYSGPVFLWSENLRAESFIVHTLIAFGGVGLYVLLTRAKQEYVAGNLNIGDKTWLFCSLMLILSIGYTLA